MNRGYKYDIAISVAEEDKEIAKLIVGELYKKRIRYYYYEEKAAECWGEYIINLTADSYGRSARYVLMITSKYFVKKYWSNIERQIALSNLRPGNIHILQLKLDSTAIDGLSEHVVYQEWNNNPEEIAELLKQKIREQKRAGYRRMIGYLSIPFVFIAMILITYFISRPARRHPKQTSNMPTFRKILITHLSALTDRSLTNERIASNIMTDSFYMSNTEVTIAQFRDYCNNQQKSLPVQPPLYDENGPVVNVTWDEAQQFCNWNGGRLPTTAEWEYAASAGLQVRYSGGNNAQHLALYNREKPGVVATKKANSFGLYDMTGNVAEWCGDWSDSTNIYKYVKGGAYNSNITELTISNSVKEKPTARKPYIGFRILWDK
jgi:hypothetical protein